MGGHSGVTIIPLLSQSSHPLPASVDQAAIEALTKRIQFGGDEVVKAKDGTGSATLSMAYAGAQFAEKALRALKGEKGIIAPTYIYLSAGIKGGEEVKSEIGANLDYFSAPVELGVGTLTSQGTLDLRFVLKPNGVERVLPLGSITDFEKGLLKAAIPELEDNINKAS